MPLNARLAPQGNAILLPLSYSLSLSVYLKCLPELLLRMPLRDVDLHGCANLLVAFRSVLPGTTIPLSQFDCALFRDKSFFRNFHISILLDYYSHFALSSYRTSPMWLALVIISFEILPVCTFFIPAIYSITFVN